MPNHPSNQQPDQPVKRKSPRWMKIFLTISLALNLLIIGAAAAKIFLPRHNMAGGKHHGALARPAAMHHAGRYLMWKLPLERRQQMLQLVRSHRKNMAPEFTNLSKTRLALARLITSQPDNKVLFEEAYTSVKNAEAALHQKASTLTKNFINALTPEERKTYAEILQNPPSRRWFKRKSEY